MPDLGVLPVALRERNAERMRSFEASFEPLRLSALAIHARPRLIPQLKDDSLGAHA